ncbi:MAG: hypothetical protein K2M41_04270 [Muribaculaceae bacterium]|nr:hypothetical protein [Muribaculaceae bacterium]
MSKTKLKKALNALEKEELINTIIELYDARKDAKDYLEYWLAPDPQGELEKCVKLVNRQFYTPQGLSRRSPQSSAISKILKDFSTICFEPEKVAELMMQICTISLNWINEKYRGVSHRTSLQKRLTELEQYIELHQLEDLYGLKLSRLRESVTEMLERYANDSVPYTHRRRRRYW